MIEILGLVVDDTVNPPGPQEPRFGPLGTSRTGRDNVTTDKFRELARKLTGSSSRCGDQDSLSRLELSDLIQRQGGRET